MSTAEMLVEVDLDEELLLNSVHDWGIHFDASEMAQ
tara:strand:+ start:231 stop:338 length:108 start_codon:yes stop_codon:yes gene_type:complete